MIYEQESEELCNNIASKESRGSISRNSKYLLEKSSDSIHSKQSSDTFSTTVEARSDIEGATSNTLSMVSTPWTTESEYSFIQSSGSTKMLRSSCELWTHEFSSSFVEKTSASITNDWQTESGSLSVTTLPIFSLAPTRHSSRLQVSPESSRSTDSSWTLKTLTNMSQLSSQSDRQILKVKYPWSPDTLCSGADEYPSSIDSLASRKGSRVDVVTSITEEIYYPMNYITLTHQFDESHMLDWALTKEIGFPYAYTTNLIDTRV